MTPEAFQRYLEGKFAADLAEHQAASLEALHRLGIPGPEKCGHHGVPKSRIVPLHPRLPIPDRAEEFWLGWYTTSLSHQAVHRYAPHREDAWLERFGGHPLPLAPIGLGCWRVAKPASLLKRLLGNVSMAPSVCCYLEGRVKLTLVLSMINPVELSSRLLADRDFDREHPVEALVGKCMTEWSISRQSKLQLNQD